EGANREAGIVEMRREYDQRPVAKAAQNFAFQDARARLWQRGFAGLGQGQDWRVKCHRRFFAAVFRGTRGSRRRMPPSPVATTSQSGNAVPCGNRVRSNSAVGRNPTPANRRYVDRANAPLRATVRLRW